MRDSQNPIKILTIGALLLHMLVHLWFAHLSYLDSLRYVEGTFNQTVSLGFAFFFGGLGMIALWLALMHYTSEPRIGLLQNWGGIHVLVIILLFTAIILHPPNQPPIGPPLDIFQVYYAPLLIMLTPPILVIITGIKESSYHHRGGTIGES
jgi:hypothetical protein